MRWVYSSLLTLLLPLALVRLWWRGRRNPGYRSRWRERLGGFSGIEITEAEQAPVIWVHAVSVGESQAAQPLIKRLLSDYPGYRILVTTTTPTGADQVRRLFDADVTHRYFPYDLPFVVRRYLDAVQPSLVLFMETEIWPNLLAACDDRGIPAALITARLSQKSARGYGWLGSLTRETLERFHRIGVQTAADGERFKALGAPSEKVVETGSLKFDIRLPPSVKEQSEVLRLTWGLDRPVWVAASTHEGEEEIALKTHQRILERFPGSLLVLVPRHPERFDAVAQRVESHGICQLRRSRQPAPNSNCQVYLGDTMGELPIFLAAADVAFVGGSFVPIGGHNILEPGALGVPVVFGPHMFNFSAIADMFIDAGAARQVADEDELVDVLTQWFSDPDLRVRVGETGRRLVEDNRGALDRTLKLVAELLPEWP